MKIILLITTLLISFQCLAKHKVWLDRSWSVYDPADPYSQKAYSISLPLEPIANSQLYQFELYHINGKLAAKGKTNNAMWSNDPFIGKLVSYYPDGTLKTSGVFSTLDHDCQCDTPHTVKDGKFSAYFNNGQVHYERTYKNGKLEDGDYKEFDKAGLIAKTYSIKNGDYDGVRKDFINGKLVRKTPYKRGKQHGMFVQYKDGQPIVKTEYKAGKQDGIEQRFNNGNLVAEYQFTTNSKKGIQKEFYANGVLKKLWMAGKYGLPEGETFTYNEQGTLTSYTNFTPADKGKSERNVYKEFNAEGELILKRLHHGRYSLEEKYNDKGELIERTERDKDGLEGLYVRNGYTKIKAHYQNGELHGQYYENAKNGAMSEGRYVHDKRQGLWIERKADGSRTEAEFHEGQKNGRFAVFDKDGRRIRYAHFSDGKINGDVSVDNKNGLHIVGHYKNGKRHGEINAYSQDGKLLETGHYRNDKPQGVIYVFGRNGRMVFKETYKDGVPDGEWLKTNTNGKVIERKQFKDGKVVRKKMPETGNRGAVEVTKLDSKEHVSEQ